MLRGGNVFWWQLHFLLGALCCDKYQWCQLFGWVDMVKSCFTLHIGLAKLGRHCWGSGEHEMDQNGGVIQKSCTFRMWWYLVYDKDVSWMHVMGSELDQRWYKCGPKQHIWLVLWIPWEGGRHGSSSYNKNGTEEGKVTTVLSKSVEPRQFMLSPWTR